jgi:FixJ family two-component response regulator
MMTPRSLITVVDNDKLVRNAIRRLLQSLGFAVAAYASAEAYLQSGLIAQTACLILDVRMTDMTGLELQGFLAANGLRTPIVFVSTSANATTRAQALQAGAVDFLHKPATDTALLNAISAALRRNECCEEKNPACAGAA